MVTLYHPELKTTIEVSEASVPVHKRAGWTDELPTKEQTQTPPAKPSAAKADEGSK